MHNETAVLAATNTAIVDDFLRTREYSMILATPLSDEDCGAQSMPDASPVKWHLAHTSWFFETFILEKYEPDFAPFHPAFRVLFNSYYEGVGDKHPRPQRGMLTRPSLAEIRAYRANVDLRMQALLLSDICDDNCLRLLELGMQHEQQHQELIHRDLAVHRRQHGLERSGHDIAVDRGAEQGRAVPEAQLDVAGGAGIGAGADRVLVVVHQADVQAERVDEGVDRAVALPRWVSVTRSCSRGLDRYRRSCSPRCSRHAVRDVAVGGAVLLQVFAREQFVDVAGRDFAAAGVGVALDHAREFDLQAARQFEAVFLFQQVGHAALAGLAVDADHGVVAAAEVGRVDRQVGHFPQARRPAAWRSPS
jgi:hypothetical protein